MVDSYIKNFLKIIRHGSNVNTYKLAWAKAIVEITTENPEIEKIHFELIANKVFKYYWNQTIYFNLIQSNNPIKEAEIVKEVKKHINLYFSNIEKRKPIHFEKVENLIDINIRKIIRILKQDVSWRFLKIKEEQIPLYAYNRGNDYLIIKHSKIIADYSDILFESINFKWTQVLESFNSSPRIAKKVRIMDFPNLKRSSLSKFKIYLNKENPNHICFICNNSIEKENSAIDHVIPWSYLYSDDIWNLVYVHQSCNSKKSNSIPTENDILNLEKRNLTLLKLLEIDENLNNSKLYNDLEIGVERDYVKKFWISSKN